MSHPSADYATPERALASYQAAHARLDIDGAASAIDFQQEALDLLSGGKSAPGVFDESTVQELSARRETEYRQLLANGGFGRGHDIATCQLISKLEQSESTAKFALRTTNLRNGTIIFSLGFVRSAAGWKIVRTR